VSPLLALAVLLGVALAGTGLVAGVSYLVRVDRSPLLVPPHAGGLPPAEHAVSRFHVRWYTVAMVFLAFDMEMLFMYPWTLVVARTGTSAVVEMFVFLGVLLAGVVYAWREGAFRWT
jgi:NADH-quinone oxidoreductase subunit A